MKTILITGGTGMVGTALTELLLQLNYKVILLSRTLHKDKREGVSVALWDIRKREIDHGALTTADSIIHLAGAGLMDKRWTSAYKKEIVSSRVDSLNLIMNTLRSREHRVKTLVSASAIGWYGRGEKGKVFTENDPPANDFLGNTCRLWEQAAEQATDLGIRVVKLRCGVVLSNKGGAYPELKRPLNYGIAAIFSKGSQVMSWIDIEDLCRIYLFMLEHEELSGSFNAVAPELLPNKVFMTKLAKLKKGKFFIPLNIPSLILKLILGESSIEILKNAPVSSQKIKDAGFTFMYPSAEASFNHLEKTTDRT